MDLLWGMYNMVLLSRFMQKCYCNNTKVIWVPALHGRLYEYSSHRWYLSNISKVLSNTGVGAAMENHLNKKTKRGFATSR